MRYLPIELDVQGREALFIGAGPEVPAKIARLLSAGARVTLIAEGDIGPDLEAREHEGSIRVLRRAFTEADLDGKAIVFVAPFTTPEQEQRARYLHAKALAAGSLVCTIDRPEASTFINAAVVSASGLVMSFSTGGVSPGLLRRIREDLGALFSDPRFGRFMEALAKLRQTIPRGERAAKMAEAVQGFAIEARLHFPAWFEPQRPHDED